MSDPLETKLHRFITALSKPPDACEHYGEDGGLCVDCRAELRNLLAALLPTLSGAKGCIGCGARTVVAYTIDRKPGPFCHECWRDLKMHVSRVNLLNAAVDRRELDVELPDPPAPRPSPAGSEST